MDRQDLTERYNAGERNSRSADLRGVQLSEVKSSAANLSRAGLSKGDLSWTNSNSANLGSAALGGVSLSTAHHDKATISPEGFGTLGDIRLVCEETTFQEAESVAPPPSLDNPESAGQR